MTRPIDNLSGIRGIARQAGVSTATVSRVLNGSAPVSSETRARVLEAVNEHQYRPNAAAKALATRRTRTVAAIIPTLEYSIFAKFMNVLEDELALAGYSLVIATHRFNYETELKRCRDVLQLGAEAVIVSGAEHHPEMLALMESAGVPCVYTSTSDSDSPVPTIGYDNRALAKQAIDYLASLGHRHIGVIHGPTAHNDRMRQRLAGVQDAVKDKPGLKTQLVASPISEAGGATHLAHWQASGTLPEACLCLADVYALGLLQEAQRLGINVPADISVMGFENHDWTEQSCPRLTSLSLPTVPMGRATARAIAAQLDDGAPIVPAHFDADIVERESTRRADQPLT